MPTDAHAAGGAESGAQMTRADPQRAGNILEAGQAAGPLRELIDSHEQAGRGRCGRVDGGPESPELRQHEREQQHGQFRGALRLIGLHQFRHQSAQRHRQHERPVPQRFQRLGVRQLEGDKKPRQRFALRLGVVVKLERKHQQAFARFQANGLVVDAHRRGGPQRADQHEAVVQRAPPPRAVEVGRGLALEADDVGRQQKVRGGSAEQLVRRLRQPRDQFLEVEGGMGWHF